MRDPITGFHSLETQNPLSSVQVADFGSPFFSDSEPHPNKLKVSISMFFTMLDALSILSRVRNYYKEAFTGEIFSKTSVLTHVLRKG